MTAADLGTYVGARDDRDGFVQQCWAEAVALVARYVGSVTVPEDVERRARLEVGSELYHRQKAPQGVAQFADMNGEAVRVGRDPMSGAYMLLRPFVGGGFA